MTVKKTDSLRYKIEKEWKRRGKHDISIESYEFALVVLCCLENIAETERTKLQALADAGEFSFDNAYVAGQITYWARASSAFKWAGSIIQSMASKVKQ